MSFCEVVEDEQRLGFYKRIADIQIPETSLPSITFITKGRWFSESQNLEIQFRQAPGGTRVRSGQCSRAIHGQMYRLKH